MPVLRPSRPASVLRAFLANEASAGLVLMASAVLALIFANSPLADSYFAALKTYLGPLSVLHWINDGLLDTYAEERGFPAGSCLRAGNERTGLYGLF